MKYLDNGTITVNITKNITVQETFGYTISCDTCRRAFINNQKKFKWRLNSRSQSITFWRENCSTCFRTTLEELRNQLNTINLNDTAYND